MDGALVTDQLGYSSNCSSYISDSTTYENCQKNQDILVIIFFILITSMFDQELILQGEIKGLSLLGVKW